MRLTLNDDEACEVVVPLPARRWGFWSCPRCGKFFRLPRTLPPMHALAMAPYTAHYAGHVMADFRSRNA